MKVDRVRIVDVALDMLQKGGVDGLTTRALARRLGVQQPALYWHFRNKRALLDALNDEILARGHIHRLPDPDEDWRTFLCRNAQSFREALLAYRDGARVHAGTEASPGDLSQIEQQLTFITVETGLAPAAVMELLVAIGRYTVGCVLEEQADAPKSNEVLDAAAAGFPLLREALGHYRGAGAHHRFRAGLEMLIAGAVEGLLSRHSWSVIKQE